MSRVKSSSRKTWSKVVLLKISSREILLSRNEARYLETPLFDGRLLRRVSAALATARLTLACIRVMHTSAGRRTYPRRITSVRSWTMTRMVRVMHIRDLCTLIHLTGRLHIFTGYALAVEVNGVLGPGISETESLELERLPSWWFGAKSSRR